MVLDIYPWPRFQSKVSITVFFFSNSLRVLDFNADLRTKKTWGVCVCFEILVLVKVLREGSSVEREWE